MSDRVSSHEGSARMEFDELYSIISGLEARVAALEAKSSRPISSGWTVTNLSTDKAVDGAANPELSALVNAFMKAGVLRS